MPGGSLPNSACPPRKTKTPQGPKSKNVVDVEKLKSSNENQEPGVEKKNVKFLFGLLEQASNEREQLMKQIAENNETIDMISEQRHLEEVAFRKVLTTERKKFDKKILDARNMLQRREDLLSQWAEVGITASRKCVDTEEQKQEQEQAAGSGEHAAIVALLKRTCRLVPDALDAAQKEEFNINARNDKHDKGGEQENDENENENENEHEEEDEDEDDVKGTQQQDEDGFEYANEQDYEQQDMDENSIGGHTMSGSILMGESPKAKKKSKTKNTNKEKVDSRLNMGSGILEDNQPAAHLKSMSISDMVADDDISQLLDKHNSDSMQFQTLSHISVTEDNDNSKSKSKSKNVKKVSGKSSSGMSSLSYHEQSHHSRAQEEEERRKKTNTKSPSKKLESASLDLSDTSSSKKYWWDHLVDENSEEKGKEGNNVTAGLMLGSGLDKGDRGDREAKEGGSKSKQESEDVHEDQLEQKRNAGQQQQDEQQQEVGGGGSVMSLCSDDFKFSTTST